ncbi:MAG TPA: hypothetical protein VM597_39480, partial [Gemmataceae bacterium]|nr:hypothetical protein [Gemmataceae bacterium]
MTWTLLALTIAAPPPAADPPVEVTGRFAGKTPHWEGRGRGRDRQGQQGPGHRCSMGRNCLLSVTQSPPSY